MVGVSLTTLGICAAVVLGVVLGKQLGALTGVWASVVKIGCTVLLGIIVVGGAKALFGDAFGLPALAITALVLLVPEWLSAAADGAGRKWQGEGCGKLLIVAVIALHHVPEGIAAGISCRVGGSACMAVCGAVAVHTVPETMVLMPMLTGEAYPRGTAYAAAAISGAMEILGVVIGYCI